MTFPTIDDAIRHSELIAADCPEKEIGKDHAQIAAWLTELKLKQSPKEMLIKMLARDGARETALKILRGWDRGFMCAVQDRCENIFGCVGQEGFPGAFTAPPVYRGTGGGRRRLSRRIPGGTT
jgi:hypothetical protein